MYLDWYGLAMIEVKPLSDVLYLATSGEIRLRKYPVDLSATNELADYLRGMTAFDFLIGHLVRVNSEIYFEL
jgi:hypothetical protein